MFGILRDALFVEADGDRLALGFVFDLEVVPRGKAALIGDD